MTNELKAMFWTMGIIVGVSAWVGLAILTQGWSAFATLILLVIFVIYIVTLSVLEDW